MSNLPLKASMLLLLSIPFYTCAQTYENGFNAIVTSEASYNDNIFGIEEKTSDTILAVIPQLVYKGEYGKHSFTSKYEGNYNVFSKNNDVNYFNHELESTVDLSHSTKWDSKIIADIAKRVELPGTNNQALTNVTEYNSLATYRLILQSSYGKRDSIGQLVFRYSRQNFNYKNNNQSYRDRSTDELRGTFFWRFAPKSRAQFQLRHSKVSSDQELSFNQTATQNSMLAGLEWEATSKTQGSVLVGYQNTNFDNPLIESISGLSYFLDVDYLPDSTSKLNLSLSRTTRDNATVIVGGLETTDLAASWKSKIKQRMYVDAKLILRNDKFIGINDSRKDDNVELAVEFGYAAYRWLDLYSSFKRLNRNSDLNTFEFDNNQLSIGIKMQFD